MRVLAIETSCDETSVAVLSGSSAQPCLEAHIVLSQQKKTKKYGGIVPEVVARAHLTSLNGVITQALRASKRSLSELDLIAATCGPGLLGGLIVGSMTAKALALARGLPFMPINHLEGHALSPRLSELTSTQAREQSSPTLDFPYLLLLVSGGHCQLLHVEALGCYKLLGQTLDDSVGECLDKGARLLGLTDASGAALERAAMRGDASRFAKDFITLPTPMRTVTGCDFSFSGLKSSLARTLSGRILRTQQRYDGAAALQQAVISCLCDRSERALKLILRQYSKTRAQKKREGDGILRFCVAGGVAANRALNSALRVLAEKHGFAFFNPRQEFCTDNAAMVAYAALARAECNQPRSGANLDFYVRPRWHLDKKAYVRVNKNVRENTYRRTARKAQSNLKVSK